MAIEILGWDLNIGVGRVIKNTGIYFVGLMERCQMMYQLCYDIVYKFC
jgi:hypothetical protein